MKRSGFFYGWLLVPVALVAYGFGAPAVTHTWGFYLPEILDELSLTRTEGGSVFGLMNLVVGLSGVIAGMSISRFGLRRVMTFGYALSALGLLLTSRAQGFWGLLLALSLLGGLGKALSTILPTQTLASIWFVRYRARVMAILLASAGLFTPLIYAFNTWVLREGSGFTWRSGWVMLAGSQLAFAALLWIFVRDSPEAIGQFPDGAASRSEVDERVVKRGTAASETFTVKTAMRTPQFFLLILCGIGYAVPYYVTVTHGRLHMQDLGLSLETAAAVLSAMALISTAGRLSGGLGDFLSPSKLLGVALLLEAAGMATFLYASTVPLAYLSMVLIGLGFGTAYISQAATFAAFFGRQAFATTSGWRFAATAPFNSAAPALAGWVFEASGSYAWAFLPLAVFGAGSALVALTVTAPTPPHAPLSA